MLHGKHHDHTNTASLAGGHDATHKYWSLTGDLQKAWGQACWVVHAAAAKGGIQHSTHLSYLHDSILVLCLIDSTCNSIGVGIQAVALTGPGECTSLKQHRSRFADAEHYGGHTDVFRTFQTVQLTSRSNCPTQGRHTSFPMQTHAQGLQSQTMQLMGASMRRWRLQAGNFCLVAKPVHSSAHPPPFLHTAHLT